MLVAVEHAGSLALVIPPDDARVAGREHLAQLVADQLDRCLEVELAGDGALDRGDHRELADARVERPIAVDNLRLERSFPAQGGKRRRKLASEQRQQFALGMTEATGAAVDIGIEKAEEFFASK